MLMGCHGMCKLEGYNVMIEGDSFSAIQWGSGKSRCPWRVADCVVEIHQISTRLDCSFHHFSREANDIADCLAREGTLRVQL